MLKKGTGSSKSSVSIQQQATHGDVNAFRCRGSSTPHVPRSPSFPTLPSPRIMPTGLRIFGSPSGMRMAFSLPCRINARVDWGLSARQHAFWGLKSASKEPEGKLRTEPRLPTRELSPIPAVSHDIYDGHAPHPSEARDVCVKGRATRQFRNKLAFSNQVVPSRLPQTIR